MIQFTANGIASAQIMAGDRPPRPGTVPIDPVRLIIAYYGRVTTDAPNRTFTTIVTQSSWPQWNGATVRRTIVELAATRLRVVADPIRDPQGGGSTRTWNSSASNDCALRGL